MVSKKHHNRNDKNDSRDLDLYSNNTSRRYEKETDTLNMSGESKSNIITFLVTINTVFLIIIMILLLNGSSGGSHSEIKDISQKVDAIDNFFSENIEGYNSGGNSNPSQDSYGGGYRTPSNPQNLEVDIVGEPFKGDESAPVVIVEFSDYECPFCARFYSQTLPLIEEQYINTGQVKLVYKDFPLSFHRMGEPAAIAANCVHEQLGNDKYWEMHDLIFENQQILTQSNLDIWAEELGVNSDEYESCIANPEMIQEVQEDIREGSALGVSGTPSFVINGELVVGAQPFSVISEVIERKLEEGS